MRILTAIDLLGLPATPVDAWSFNIRCPHCQEDAWAVSDFMQCRNSACALQVASPEDLLVTRYGTHEQVAQILAKKFNVTPDFERARQRSRERLVLDLWLLFCMTPPTTEALQETGRMRCRGLGLSHSKFGAIMLDSNQMAQLIAVALRTGAEFPEAWLKTPPKAVRAFCVQTRPHTIDRIVIEHRNDRREEIVWHSYAAGVCSLMGLLPDQPKLMAANFDSALRLQHSLAAIGQTEDIACAYSDLRQGGACPRWDVQSHLLTATPRHCSPQLDPEHFCADDIVQMQHAFDQFPGIERSLRGLPVDHVLSLRPRDQAVAWSSLRFAMIAGMIPKNVTQMPPSAASIFEQTGTKSEDANALIDYYTRQGRDQLVSDIATLSLTRVISRDRNNVIQETASDYRVIRGHEVLPISNFSLRVTANVNFRNHKLDRYCQATLRCGPVVTDVIFPQTLLNDRVQSLEDELQRHFSVGELASQAGKMPTVIEINKFRQHVIPHLRTQAAKATPIRGVDQLGWSENRKSFMFPGFVMTLDGTTTTSNILCPAVPVLARYRTMQLADWASACPTPVDSACRDVVAMLVASSVRYFRRCATQPIPIAQSSAAMTVLDKISSAFGQHEIHTMNQNVRDGNRVDGIHGYPLLAAGPRHAAMSSTPFIHLTDNGYIFATHPDSDQAIAGGRAAQFCIRRAVEWCLSTGGDEFKESPALLHHRSLLREGRWLIEHACNMENWEVSAQDETALEKLLAQIPYEEAGRRITLIDGQDLHIDIHGLQRDHDGILREARDMGTLAAIEGDKLVAPAVKLLPAIGVYYTQEPDVTVITT